MPRFNYAALLGKIKEMGFTQRGLASAAGISESMLSAKLNGHYPFTQTDIQNIATVLDISPMDFGRYFFCVAG